MPLLSSSVGLLCSSRTANALDLSSITATLLRERGVVVVNITFPVESSSQISLNLVCASGQSGAISQQMNQTDFISFELPVPDGCREPVLHLIEAKGSGLTSRKNDLRLIPVPYPIPAEPS